MALEGEVEGPRLESWAGGFSQEWLSPVLRSQGVCVCVWDTRAMYHTHTHTHTHTHMLAQRGPQIASQFDIEKTPSQQAITNKVIQSRQAEIDSIFSPSV